jgi:WD40 repeat protein
VAYSPSEDLIVSGSTDGTIKLWRQGGVGEANSFY